MPIVPRTPRTPRTLIPRSRFVVPDEDGYKACKFVLNVTFLLAGLVPADYRVKAVRIVGSVTHSPDGTVSFDKGVLSNNRVALSLLPSGLAVTGPPIQDSIGERVFWIGRVAVRLARDYCSRVRDYRRQQEHQGRSRQWLIGFRTTTDAHVLPILHGGVYRRPNVGAAGDPMRGIGRPDTG